MYSFFLKRNAFLFFFTKYPFCRPFWGPRNPLPRTRTLARPCKRSGLTGVHLPSTLTADNLLKKLFFANQSFKQASGITFRVSGDRSFDPSPTKSTKSLPSTTGLRKKNLISSSTTIASTVWVTSWKVATNKWPASAKCHSLIKVLIHFGHSLIKMWYFGCCFHWFLQLCLCNWFVCSNFAPEYLEERNNEKKYLF